MVVNAADNLISLCIKYKICVTVKRKVTMWLKPIDPQADVTKEHS